MKSPTKTREENLPARIPNISSNCASKRELYASAREILGRDFASGAASPPGVRTYGHKSANVNVYYYFALCVILSDRCDARNPAGCKFRMQKAHDGVESIELDWWFGLINYELPIFAFPFQTRFPVRRGEKIELICRIARVANRFSYVNQFCHFKGSSFSSLISRRARRNTTWNNSRERSSASVSLSRVLVSQCAQRIRRYK